jgi:hypothetical protein
MRRSLSVARALTLALASISSAAAIGAEPLRFVSCPIYRDTDAGRKSGCWLTDDAPSGNRYDISQSPTKPDWNYAVLIEGVVAAKQDKACGGIVLDPVRVSVLAESCTRHMLPAESYSGRRFVLPARNVRPMSEARPVPPKPWSDRVFTLVFDYNRSFAVYQLDDYLLDQAITWIRAVHPRQIIITGYAATTPVEVSGRSLAEKPEIADARAEFAAESLRRLGVDPRILVVQTRLAAQPAPAEGADGLTEPSRRRVEIDVRL